jgi:trans-2,3-dihydro-3-hydroxyanthranilate isomerase
MQVDAFTERPLAGNPCAIIFEADDLTADQMLAIAKEMNLSETAFVLKSQIADVRARYFTPAEEIPLAGHPTIATMHALVETEQIKLHGDYTKISLELQVGPVPIELYKTVTGVRVVMNQKKPQFLATLDPDGVMPHFGLTAADCLPNALPQIVSTGTPQLMIPVCDLDALRRAWLNSATYPAFRNQAGFFSPHLFCLQSVTDAGDTFARHFGVPPDTMEDPFTGSATGGMAAYLWHHKLLTKSSFIAEQGHWMNRPGQAQVEVVGPPEDIETVKVGGTAVTVMTGQLTI